MSEPINLLVLDLSHYDVPCDLAQAYEDGIRGVIWKATEGTGYTDPTYLDYREQALEADMLWGAYHFANASDAQKQARYFVQEARIGEGDLFALDWEPNDSNTMSAQAAATFVNTVETLLGRPKECVIYGSSSFLTDRIPESLDAFFSFRRLWLAQYGETPKVPPTWKDYWLWQYAADGAGPMPHTVKGIPGEPDANSFPRSEEALFAEWATGQSLEPRPPSSQKVLITIHAPPGIEVEVKKL